MTREFLRISPDQAHKDGLTEQDWMLLTMPSRGTQYSAGYDLGAAIQIAIPAHSMRKVPTGIRVLMESDEVLLIHVRSSLGFKKGIRLANCTGVIDADYSNAANEGHIWVALYNDSDEPYMLQAGERFAQGIFMKYLITDEDSAKGERIGGMGSTG